MFTKDHSWETFQHPKRDKHLIACGQCGVVRFNKQSRQGLCSERGLSESLITQYGYSPERKRLKQPA